MGNTARNVSLVALIWLATTAFLAITDAVSNSIRGDSEGIWFIVTPSEIATTLVLAAWAYFVARISRGVFVGPGRLTYARTAIAVLLLWVFVGRAGWEASNYTDAEWLAMTMVMLGLPICAFVLGMRLKNTQPTDVG